VGISATPDGKLLNRQDGSFVAPVFGQIQQHLWAYFCRVGQDAPEMAYRIGIRYNDASQSAR
jgi:hypothetical protein